MSRARRKSDVEKVDEQSRGAMKRHGYSASDALHPERNCRRTGQKTYSVRVFPPRYIP